MEQETLFTATKWDILKALETGEKSPFQLSIECKTSIANISQQLRMLELANLVTVRRIPNRDKGQPRVGYSLKANNSYIIACTPGFVQKTPLELSKTQRATMKIWLSTDPSRHYFIEKAFWGIQSFLAETSEIYYDTKNYSSISLIIVSEKEASKKEFSDYYIEHDGANMGINFNLKTKKDFKKTSSMIRIY